MADFTIASRVIIGAIGATAYTNSVTGQKLARDNNGRLWAICPTTGVGFTGKLLVHYSDDNGSSWSVPEVIATPVSAFSRQPGIFIDNANKVVVSHADPGDTTLQRFWRRYGNDVTPAWTLEDGFIAWGVSGQFTTTYQNFIQDRSSGRWWAVYFDGADESQLLYTYSDDDLESFVSGVVLDSTTGTGRIRDTFDSTGAVALFYDDAGALYVGVVALWQANAAAGPRVYRWSGAAWARFDSGDHVMQGSVGSGGTFCLSLDEARIICVIGNFNSGEVSKMSVLDFTSPGDGWTAMASVGSRRGAAHLTLSADGVMHLVQSANGVETVYRRSTDHGQTWSAEETVNTGLDGQHTAFLMTRESSRLWPSAGCALVIFRTSGAATESYYIGSDDLAYPVIASGLRVTRLILRAIGPVPIRVQPLDLPSVLPNVLLHNWSDGLEIESSFQTDVTESADELAEERRALADRPTRIMKARLTGMRRGLSAKLLANLARMTSARMPVPIYCDESVIAATSSGTDVYCETRWRRFFKGGRVVVFNVRDGEPRDVVYRIVSKMTPDRLLLTTTLGATYNRGARVFPCMDAEVSMEALARLLTDAHAEADVSFAEVYGYSALPVTVTLNPGEFPMIGSYPVLDIPPDWGGELQLGVARGGRRFSQGRAEVVTTAGDKPRFKHRLQFSEGTREDVWRLIRFFDSRRGRCRAFWLVSPAVIFTVEAFGAGYIDVTASGNAEDIETFLSYVGIVETNGQITILGIDSVEDNGDTFRINHDGSTAGLTLEDVSRVTSAHLCRLASDSMTERWHTLEAADISFEAIDLISEAEVTVPGFE